MEATKQTFKLLPPSILPKESTMIIQMKPGHLANNDTANAVYWR